jgi:hypothetical protein
MKVQQPTVAVQYGLSKYDQRRITKAQQIPSRKTGQALRREDSFIEQFTKAQLCC